MTRQAITISLLVLLLSTSQVLAENDAGEMKKLKAADWTVPDVDLEMKLIPAGSFVMGSPADEAYRRDDEVQHKVTISKPFYMGVYEVTQRQFYKLMMPDYDFDDWTFKRGPVGNCAAFCFRFPALGFPRIDRGARSNSMGGPQTDLNPMECVIWDRAQAFCGTITQREKKAGRLPEGYVYRLPTEAEWEYACRAGTHGPFNVEVDYGRLHTIRKFAWVAGGSSSFGTRSVGTPRKPNAWGLFDMHGNVAEWCLDWYAPYPSGEQSDPVGPAAGNEKVIRGGSFSPKAPGEEEAFKEKIHPYLRSATRYSVPPEMTYLAILGFRVVLAPKIGD